MDRILTHPILGDTPEGRLVNFTYDGQTLQGIEGEPIAAALRVAGVMTHRYTKKRHEPRGVFCAIGRCTDCVMVVNGKPNIRTCITPLEEGMDVRTQYGAGWIDRGLIERDFLTTFGEIIRGKKPGRESDDEIILVSIEGMPTEDVAWTYECYTYVLVHDIGTKLKVWDRPYAF